MDRQGQHFPKAGHESVSSRTLYQRWLHGAQNGAAQALQALEEYGDAVVIEGGQQARTRLGNSLSAPLQLFRQALMTRIRYVGGVHGETDMAQAVNMLQVAEAEMLPLKHRLAENTDDLDDYLASITQFLIQLIADFDTFERQARADESAVPEGMVDWEGQNVVNSQATESLGLHRAPIPHADLISDQWGGGVGGQLLMNVLINHNNNDHEDLS